MSLHPDVVRIMLKFVTPDEFAEIYRVQWEIDQRRGESHDMEGQGQAQDRQVPPRAKTPEDAAPSVAPATSCNAGATRPLTSTERSRKFRAKQKALKTQRDAVACSVAVAPPLSPIKIQDPEKACNVAPVARAPFDKRSGPPPGAHPLPEDWQPSAGRRVTAVKAGGEIGAANLIAKFCNHFHARAHEMRTAAGWQGRFSNWIITEWPAGNEPRLPLMRPVEASRPDDKWEALRQKVHGMPPLRRESG